MNADMTVEEMLQTLCEAQNDMFRNEWDRLMHALDADFPGYGWSINVGYGTPVHKQGLERLGVCVHHRRSYRPIRNILRKSS